MSVANHVTFWDFLISRLYGDAAFYFNVVILNIYVNPIRERGLDLFPQGVKRIWYLENIWSPRPSAIQFVLDPTLPKDEEYEFEVFSHMVLEVSPTEGVMYYDMLDYETRDPWQLEEEYDDEENPYEEVF